MGLIRTAALFIAYWFLFCLNRATSYCNQHLILKTCKYTLYANVVDFILNKRNVLCLLVFNSFHLSVSDFICITFVFDGWFSFYLFNLEMIFLITRDASPFFLNFVWCRVLSLSLSFFSFFILFLFLSSKTLILNESVIDLIEIRCQKSDSSYCERQKKKTKAYIHTHSHCSNSGETVKYTSKNRFYCMLYTCK